MEETTRHELWNWSRVSSAGLGQERESRLGGGPYGFRHYPGIYDASFSSGTEYRALLLALAISGPAALLRSGHFGAGFRAEGPLFACGCGLACRTATAFYSDGACQEVTCFTKASNLLVDFRNQGMSIHSAKSSAFDFISPVTNVRTDVISDRKVPKMPVFGVRRVWFRESYGEVNLE